MERLHVAMEEARKFIRIVVLLFVVNSGLLAVPNVDAELIRMPDGLTIYDTVLKVRWLANANLAGTEDGRFGINNITPNGSMDYPTAIQWLTALNSLNGGSGYLGHNNWTLPTTPTYPVTDPSCSSFNRAGGGSFGFSCMNSDMGSLFYVSLGLQYPDTAVPIPKSEDECADSRGDEEEHDADGCVGPFRNFQPYLYWTDTISADPSQGYHTFSFNTGWAGTNVDRHYMYALPMIKGNPFGMPVNGDGLQRSADGKTVYDSKTDVTWLADADLAKTRTFGAQCTNSDGTLCINPDGSMTHTTALNWINGMKAAAYLGQTNWQLPPDPGPCGEFGCTDTPLGELYYIRFGLSQGTPAVPTPDINVGPFKHVQPYLYWSCSGPYTNPPCQNPPPAPGFEWSFSFGNGFEGTDLRANDLYVTVYFPETSAQALADAITAALGTNPQYYAFQSQAADISSAPNAQAKAAKLRAFINHVNAQRGKALTDAQADELIALAQAI